MAGVAISDHELYRRGAALAIVIVLHALLIAAWSQLSAQRRSAAAQATERRSVLILRETAPATPTQADSGAAATRPPPEEPDRSRSTAITIPTLPEAPIAPASPPVDWRLEAERSARAAVEDAARPGPRSFGPAPTPTLTPKPREFEWDPEPSRAGFAGGLPYVRLGKRCVIGLGFFGCAIGDLPAANGKLFEGLSDPNRHESSVPDAPE